MRKMQLQNDIIRTRNKGFTIVETLVVIAIIGILATIAFLSIGSYQIGARDSQRSAKATIIAEALEKYYDKNGEYPSCPAVTNPSANVVTTTVLLGLDQNTLVAPRSAPGTTNSIICAALTGSVDAFGYVGDGSAACTSGAACLQWKLEYRDEQNGQIAAINSRRKTAIATSGDTLLSATAVSSSLINITWTAVDNAVDYTLQRATDTGFSANFSESTVTGVSVAATGLDRVTTYYFRLMPNAAGSSGNWSNTASATTANDYGSLAVATSIEGYWTTAPNGFLLENGQAVSRATYADLFAVIGSTYGAGNGSTTFNVPDSRGRTAVTKSADVEFATIGQKSGSKAELLTLAQIPSHNHTQQPHGHIVSDPTHTHSQQLHDHSQNVAAGLAGWPDAHRDYKSDGAAGIYEHGVPTDNAWPTNNESASNIGFNNATATNQNAGGGSTHNNIQPSIVKNAAIKFSRIEPTAATLPVGTSIQGYWSTAPAGYVLEDGSAYSRTNPAYSDLYGLVATTYGAGNGSTTFNVPDSRGRAAVNRGTDTEFDTIGEKTGSKTEALTTAQMPVHTHVQSPHTHGISDPGHNHTQNPHFHGQEMSANGGPSIRTDWSGSYGPSGVYPQGINTGGQYGTNLYAASNIGIYNATATNQFNGGGGTHNEIQPSIVKQTAVKAIAAVADTIQPIASGTSVGSYRPSTTTPPVGYLFENGQAVSRTTYAGLFAAIGTTYGVGDGSTTFNVPDSRGRIGVNKSTDVEFDTMGEKYGTKIEALTTAQLASHTHTQNAHTHSVYDPRHNHSQAGHVHAQYVTNPVAGGLGIRNDYTSDAQGAFYSQFINTGTTTAVNNPAGIGIWLNNETAVNNDAGSGGSHNNIQPTIVKVFLIKT